MLHECAMYSHIHTKENNAIVFQSDSYLLGGDPSQGRTSGGDSP